VAKFFLQLAFVVAAFRVAAPKLFDCVGVEQVQFLYPVFYLPAVILGVRSWLKVPNFARSWPVIVCMLVVWLGVLRAGEWDTEWGFLRGFRTAALMTIVLPLGALIVEKRCWWLCTRAFIYTSALVMLVAVWFEYFADTELKSLTSHRFGLMYSADGARCLMNPNQLGSQLALAAVLAFVLHLRGHREHPRLPHHAGRRRKFNLGWTLLLSVGCLLTASRGAFAGWLGGMGLLFVWGTRTQHRQRLRDLVVQATFLFLVAIAVTVAGGPTPWGSMFARLAGADGGRLTSLGGRIPIWKNAYAAWRSTSTYTLLGAGMGRAEELLGQYDETAVLDPFGVLNRDTHSTYVNWLLSFGLLGVGPGICLLATTLRQARQMDRREKTIDRQAILANVLLFSLTGVFYNRFYWLAAAPLILAMLSPPKADSRSSSPHGRPAAKAALPTPHRLPGTKPALPRGVHLPPTPPVTTQHAVAASSSFDQGRP